MSRERVAFPHLFNFAASYVGGGLKRLHEYAKWFDARGGATFIVHPECANLKELFPANRYFEVGQSRYRRIYADGAYLARICAETGRPGLYYAYGIPVYRRVGDVNWFHLSNVLPVHSHGVPMSMLDRVRFGYLGWQIRRHLGEADVISAESMFSLEAIGAGETTKLVLSVNGSDDELHAPAPAAVRDAIAVVVGTYRYKALEDSYRVFEMLRARGGQLELVIIGRESWIPRGLAGRDGVRVTGQLPRAAVVEYLARARYYISTTRIENSYNAASEGVFLAAESFVSDIGPHRELLGRTKHQLISVPGMQRQVIHVCQSDANPDGLKTWDQVIAGMLARADAQRAHSRNQKDS